MKIVIYTALTGGYDKLIQPSVIDKDFTYICFSNDIKEKQVGVWEIRNFPIVINNAQQLSRYPKMHPYDLLADYDYSLYIDANVKINDKYIYTRIRELIEQNTVLAGMCHLEVDCAYEEGLRVLTSKRERNWKAVFNLMLYMRKNRFPYHWGMYEANCIFRDNHNKIIKSQCDLWWTLFLKYAHRDQLSYSYTLWRFKLPFVYILPLGYNTRNHSSIIAGSHGASSSKTKKLIKKYMYKPTAFTIKIVLNLITLFSK